MSETHPLDGLTQMDCLERAFVVDLELNYLPHLGGVGGSTVAAGAGVGASTVAGGVLIGVGAGYLIGAGLDHVTDGGWGRFWWKLFGGKDIDELPPGPCMSKGGNNKGRGDDDLYNYTIEELLDLKRIAEQKVTELWCKRSTES